MAGTAVREWSVDENDLKSTFHLVKTQDCEPIMKAISAIPAEQRAKFNTQRGHKYLGSVPNVVALSWAKEWGVRLYSKEWQAKSVDRLKHDPTWNRLRAPQ